MSARKQEAIRAANLLVKSKHETRQDRLRELSVRTGYASALAILSEMSRNESWLSSQSGLEGNELARLQHKQNEVALAYAYRRLKEHNHTIGHDKK